MNLLLSYMPPQICSSSALFFPDMSVQMTSYQCDAITVAYFKGMSSFAADIASVLSWNKHLCKQWRQLTSKHTDTAHQLMNRWSQLVHGLSALTYRACSCIFRRWDCAQQSTGPIFLTACAECLTTLARTRGSFNHEPLGKF